MARLLNTFGNLETYQNIFKDLLNEGILKKISDLGDSSYFRSHRAVIKQHTTTRASFFDTSAKQGFCLAKSSNLIEVIPTILYIF